MHEPPLALLRLNFFVKFRQSLLAWDYRILLFYVSGYGTGAIVNHGLYPLILGLPCKDLPASVSGGPRSTPDLRERSPLPPGNG